MVLLRLFDYQGALTVRYHRQRSFYRRRLFAAYIIYEILLKYNILSSLYRYQKGITPYIKSRKVRCLCGFPAFCLSLELGVSFVILNCIYLSLMQIHTCFYIKYIIYYGLLIFCCQNVATHLL